MKRLPRKLLEIVRSEAEIVPVVKCDDPKPAIYRQQVEVMIDGHYTRQHRRLAAMELLQQGTRNPRLTSPTHDAKPPSDPCLEPRWSKRGRVRQIMRAAGNRVTLDASGEPLDAA